MSKYATEVQCKVSDLVGGDRIRLFGGIARVVNTPTVDPTTTEEDHRRVLEFKLDFGSVWGPMDIRAFPSDPAIKVVYDDDALLADILEL